MLRKIILMLALLLPMLAVSTSAQKFTVVIDAGHGGHDSGAKGAISFEKDLTLKYALAFGRMVEQNCPDVKVIYTRTTDKFLPLHTRAEIANRNKADLFISFHINALGGGRISHGFQSYTLGKGEHTGSKGLKENLEVAKRENSVIYMEKDYKTIYKGLENTAESDIMYEFIADKNRERSVELSRLMQREVCKATGRVNGGAHQNNLAVLRLTSMPATLLELGFITTPDEEQFLNTDSALNLYTRGIYNAFIIYKRKYNDKIDVPYRADNESPAPVLVQAPDTTKRQSSRPASTPSVQRKQAKPQADAAAAPKAKEKTTQRDDRQRRDNKPQSTKADASKPIFKIQIFSTSDKVKAGSPLFKGLDDVDFYQEGGLYKYTYGQSNDYNAIYRLRKQILDKFPQAFIIAFKNGKKMNVNEGIREFKANRQQAGR